VACHVPEEPKFLLFIVSVQSPKSLWLCPGVAGSVGCFSGASDAPISELIGVEQATQKNNQLAAAQRFALKMGRQLPVGCRIGQVSIYDMRPLTPVRLVPPVRLGVPAAYFERGKAEPKHAGVAAVFYTALQKRRHRPAR
jgi:hypothetical protein